MNQQPPIGEPRYPFLERITAVVLVLVLLSLSWMAWGACRPQWALPGSLEVQVWISAILLTAALVLVSVVALLHTRS